MKILFGVHSYKPAYNVGGPIHSVSALAEGLVARGHAVTVFTSNWNLTERLAVDTSVPHWINGVEVRYFAVANPLAKMVPGAKALARLSNYNFAPELRGELKRRIGEFDVAHSHLPFVYPSLAVGRAAISAKVPFFYHQRGVFDPARLNYRSAKKRAYIEMIERPMLAKASRLFALTEAEVHSYRGLGLSNDIEIIPNGIDSEAFGAPTDPALIADLKLADSDAVILFMARLHPLKGPDLLLEAFAGVAQAFPNAKLVLAGPDEQDNAEIWRRFAGERGLGERVLLPGTVLGDRKRALLQRADVFCLPSAAEGFSIAVLEAMAASTAVLISPGCNFPEVETSGAGIVVENDVSLLQSALERFLRNPDEMKKMGQSARSLVMKNYRWNDIVKKFERTYLEVISARR